MSSTDPTFTVREIPFGAMGGVYEQDDLQAVMEPEGPARLDFEAGGMRHRLYDLTDPDRIRFATKTVASQPVIMADGHHRYNTAMQYRQLHRPGQAGPWDSIMTFVAPAEGSGLRPYFTSIAKL